MCKRLRWNDAVMPFAIQDECDRWMPIYYSGKETHTQKVNKLKDKDASPFISYKALLSNGSWCSFY